MIYGIIVAILVVAVSGIIYRRRVWQESFATKAQDAFYKSAQALVDDERTPNIVLILIDRLSENLHRSGIARAVLWFVFSGRARRLSDNPPENWKELDAAVEKLPVELRGHFLRCSVTAAFVISYRSLLFGWMFRRAFLWDARITRRAREDLHNPSKVSVAKALAHEGHDDDLVAA